MRRRLALLLHAGAATAAIAAAAEVTAAVAAEPPVKITLWAPPGASYQEPIKALLPEFHKAFPNVELVVEGKAASVALLPAFAAGTAPDIVVDSTRHAPQFVARGLFTPVDFSAFPELGPNDWNEAGFEKLWAPGLAKTLRMMGKYYFIPTEVTSFATFYNPDMLADAGYRQPASSWQELGAMSRKLQRVDASGNVTRYGLALQHGWVWDAFHMISMMRQTGTDWIDAAGRPQFSAPKAIEAVQVYADLYRNGALSDAADSAAFQAGKAGIYPGALYEYFNFSKVPSLNVQTTPYPVLQGGTATSPSYAYGVFVPTTSKHPHLAWQIAEFFYDRRWAPERFQKYSLLMPWAGSWLAQTYQATPALQAFFVDLQNAWVEPETPFDDQLNKALNAARDAIVSGKQSVANALQILDQELTPILTQPLAPIK